MLAACIGGFLETVEMLFTPGTCDTEVDKVLFPWNPARSLLFRVLVVSGLQAGQSCLHLAASRGRDRVVEWAIRSGCTPTRRDKVLSPHASPLCVRDSVLHPSQNDQTPFLLSVYRGHEGAVSQILSSVIPTPEVRAADCVLPPTLLYHCAVCVVGGRDGSPSHCR